MKLTDNDVKFIVSRLPSDVRKLLKDNAGRLFLAGGYIRATIANEEPSDIDLFGDNKTFLDGVSQKFADNRQGARTHKTHNAITVLTPERMPVQFITRWTYPTAGGVAASFDFTVCSAVIWYKDGVWDSLCHDRFYQDLAARRLHYLAPIREEEVGGSMLRVIKYLKRGYVIQVDSLGAVIARLTTAVREGTPAEDAAKVITGLLRAVDPSVSMDEIELAGEDEKIEVATPVVAGLGTVY